MIYYATTHAAILTTFFMWAWVSGEFRMMWSYEENWKVDGVANGMLAKDGESSLKLLTSILSTASTTEKDIYVTKE